MELFQSVLVAGWLADDGVASDVEDAVEVTFDALKMALFIGAGFAVGVLAGLIGLALLQLLTRRSTYLSAVIHAVRRRVEVLVAVIGAWMGFRYRLRVMPAEPPEWLDWLNHAFLIAVILISTWSVVALINGIVDAIDRRVSESSEARAARLKTQTQILQRVTVALVWILGIAGVLLTFPGARTAGASIFASAGIISVVAGLAAQTTLGNVFAGLQLAFTDSIRVGDIVIYNDAYTTVEEITLTYVVLAVWDGRRIIVPSTKMTTESFENWTRRAPEMIGDVQLYLDWDVPIEAMRMQFEQVLESSDLWDGRTGVLQISDTTIEGVVIVRALVSASNSPRLTDLRNFVREELVTWIQNEAPQAIPRGRRYMEEKGDFAELSAKTLELVRKRIKNKPPTFDPAAAAPGSSTGETEVMPQEAIEKLVRIPLAEREAMLDGVSFVDEAETTNSAYKSSLFSGSPENEERAKAYAGPGEEAYEERNRKVEEARDTQENALKDNKVAKATKAAEKSEPTEAAGE